jgi:hypothetical protein
MTLLQDLVTDTADPKHHRLSAVLLRAKVLATRLKSEALLKWVRNELDGYDEASEDVPSYRVIYPSLLGDFWGAFGAKTIHVLITLDDCPEEVRNYVGRFPLTGNCASIEALLDSRSETHHRHFNAGVVGIVRECTRIRVLNQELQTLQALFTDTEVAGVLQAIRSRLLDFLLDLEQAFPQLTGDTVSGDAVTPADVDLLVAKHLREGSAVIIQTASMEVHMGDSYTIGQAGAAGPGANASRMTFTHTTGQQAVDLQELSKELASLADQLRKEVKTPADLETLGTVAAAQMAAEQGDGPKATEYLSKILPTVWDTCGKLSIGVGIRALAKALGY